MRERPSRARCSGFLAIAAIGVPCLAQATPLRFSDPETTTTCENQPVVREELFVSLGDSRELWRLVWAAPPELACHPGDDFGMWYGWQCDGFAHGEGGVLDLVRVRDGQVLEALPLTPYFHADREVWGNIAIVARWPVEENDREANRWEWSALARKISARPTLKVMELRDYDHDGAATEFCLQIGSGGNSSSGRLGVVVGVSRKHPRLHAFRTVEHPNEPLVLRVEHWEALAESSGPVSLLNTPCDDHGNATEDVVELRVDGDGVHATILYYECKDEGTRGALLGSQTK